jgi:molybdate transport system substrate-binding protein
MPLRVFASNSVRGVTEALLPGFASTGAPPVEVVFDAAKALMRRIDAGERADVALLGTPTLQALAARGVVDPASVRPVASSGVGVAVKAGTPHPRIDTIEAFRQMLLDAPSIAHTTEGASGMYFSGLIDTLCLGPQVRHKTVTRPGGLIGEVLLAGDAVIGVQQISELRAVPGIEVVGPLPAGIQKHFGNAAGLFTGCADPSGAAALVAYLTSPDATAVYEAHGLTPGQEPA